MIRAAHVKAGNPRKNVLVPDSAHGTNPATAHFAGYEVVELASNARGHARPRGARVEAERATSRRS